MGPFCRSLKYLCQPFHHHETLPGCAQHEGSEIHLCLAEEPVQLESLPPDIGLSTMANPTALPEDLVDAVRDLKPFLPIGCEFLGQDDLAIVGAHPIDAGGFADVWIGKRNDGTAVAIKSHRCYSLSSCLPIYSVRLVLLTTGFRSRKIAGRGCTRKHRYAATSTTIGKVLYRSLEFIPPRHTHLPSFLSAWTIQTSECI